jgi:general secretion pathway protein D
MVALGVIGLLVSGCAGYPSHPGGAAELKPITVRVFKGQDSPGPAEPEEKEQSDESGPKSRKMVRLAPYAPDTDPQYVRKKDDARFSRKKTVSVAVDGMKLSEFIGYVFTDVFDRDFVIDPAISERELDKTVTLRLEKEMTQNRFFQVVTGVLADYQISTLAKDGVFYLQKNADEKQHAVGIGVESSDVPDVAGQITQLVPIQYMDATNLLSFLPKSGGAGMQIARGENMLILRGKKEDLISALEMVRVLDRPAMRGRYIGACELKYLDSKQAIEQLTNMLRQEGIPVASQPGGSGVFFTSLENRGILIYFSAEKRWLSRLEYWIKFIDRPEKTDVKKYFVYFPRNCRASSLFDSVKTLIAADTTGPPRQTSTEDNPAAASSSDTELSIKGQDIKLSVDESRNALIAYCAPEKYLEIEELLEKLDLMPVQVQLEASVVEVTLTDQLQYGLEWYLKGSGGSQSHIIKTQGGLDLGSGGLDFSLVADSEDFRLAINALMKNDLVKILSNPRVTVRDGKSASITVGTEVPVITSEAVSADAVTDGTSDTIRSVQYRSTGVQLNVTPMVHSQGVVTLEISQEVSEAQANTTSDISSPIILNRSITTEVAASDGQTVLLGGLIKENRSDTVTKVPFFGDLPVLGHLFKTTSLGGDRTELVIMITPRIIRNRRHIDEMRDAIFKSLNNIEVQ